MNKQEAFDTIMDEFSQEHRIVRVRKPNSFNLIAPNNAEYNVKVLFYDRDSLTEEPRHIKIKVTQGPHTTAEVWRRTDEAARAAQVALAILRNTGYLAQGELL